MEEKKYHYKYPRPSVTTDCLVFGQDGSRLKILLIKRGFEPFKGRWAFPGGFLEMGESAEEGVLRELEEETGLSGLSVKQLHTFSAPGRDPRGWTISIAFWTVVQLSDVEDVKGSDDAVEAEWFDVDNVPALAFDHDEMLKMALMLVRK
ncbi:MAG: NUDIX hydrolase [Prevotella sp.]|nr:NUDIX hydrolase [Prevotella sp.]